MTAESQTSRSVVLAPSKQWDCCHIHIASDSAMSMRSVADPPTPKSTVCRLTISCTGPKTLLDTEWDVTNPMPPFSSRDRSSRNERFKLSCPSFLLSPDSLSPKSMTMNVTSDTISPTSGQIDRPWSRFPFSLTFMTWQLHCCRLVASIHVC
jgi:hypothetical protein